MNSEQVNNGNSNLFQPPAFYENIWVAQVTGSTQLDLVPVEDCKDRCKTQTITLIKGDICKLSIIFPAIFTRQ